MERATISQKESVESELTRCWLNVKHQEVSGLEFGRCCLKWEAELGKPELYRLYKKLAIAPNIANWWKMRVLQEQGLVQSKKEKRNNRSGNTFDGILTTALVFIQTGFQHEATEHPEDIGRLRLAKDWATSKLKGGYGTQDSQVPGPVGTAVPLQQHSQTQVQ